MNTEILNKYVELINKGYCDDCNELNCISNFPHKEIAKNIKIILEENQELKKQLEEWNHHLKCSKEMLDLQGHNGNYNYDSYMLGIYNGMEYIIALFETREPIFKSGKDIEFISDKTQQKEFIEYLESESKELIRDAGYHQRICLEILSKYKEIMGGDNK